MEIEFKVIDYESPYYNEVIDLRNEILRIPLGLTITEDDIEEDRDQYIIISLIENQIEACVLLKILDKDTVKFRQMAVKQNKQLKGIGNSMIHFAENFCILNQYHHIVLHARETAIGFYQKLNYIIEGEPFEEVGIPHVKMIKKLI